MEIKKLSKIYSEHPEYALEKQSRKGLQNGMCRKIRIHGNNINITFDYITDCINYLINHKISSTNNISSIRWQIDKCIKNDKSYNGYYFEKL